LIFNFFKNATNGQCVHFPSNRCYAAATELPMKGGALAAPAGTNFVFGVVGRIRLSIALRGSIRDPRQCGRSPALGAEIKIVGAPASHPLQARE